MIVLLYEPMRKEFLGGAITVVAMRATVGGRGGTISNGLASRPGRAPPHRWAAALRTPFCGSGTTIIAATMTGRSCHAIEIDPGYVDVAVQRWEAFTGQAAVLDGDGRAFSEIAEQREKGTA